MSVSKIIFLRLRKIRINRSAAASSVVSRSAFDLLGRLNIFFTFISRGEPFVQEKAGSFNQFANTF